MTYNSHGMTKFDWYEGMDVVCIYDHQMHDKLNYLNRYKVLSVEKCVDGSSSLEVTTRSGKPEKFDPNYFVPLWYFEGKDMDMQPVSMHVEFGEEESLPRKIRQADIAQIARVSDTTVSKVLAGKTDHVHPVMVDAVLSAKKQLEKGTETIIKMEALGELEEIKKTADPGVLAAVNDEIASKLKATGKNPKSQYADKKPSLSLAPLSASIAQVEAQLDGKLKYGWVNWRVNRIEAHTYIEAALRHLRLYENGENYARDTKVYNLGAVMACCAILIDAEVHGTLDDNRRHSPETCDMLHTRGEEMTKHLQEMQKERDRANGN